MLRWLVELSLKQRFVVVVAGIVLLVYGGLTATRAPLDVFPEFAPPIVDVQTEAPGMSSEAVEDLISIPLESALNGMQQMTRRKAKSVQDVSQVMMSFERGTDLFKVCRMGSERVAV